MSDETITTLSIDFDEMVIRQETRDGKSTYDIEEIDGTICMAANFDAKTGKVMYNPLPPQIQEAYQAWLAEKELLR